MQLFFFVVDYLSRAVFIAPSLLPLENGWLFSAHPSECRISSKSCNIQDIWDDCRLSWGRLDESSRCLCLLACLNCLVHSWKREAVILHALYEMAHNLGPGINSSFTDHLGASDAPRSQPRRKSEIMAGYCRPTLSRKAVYCCYVVLYCTVLFNSN